MSRRALVAGGALGAVAVLWGAWKWWAGAGTRRRRPAPVLTSYEDLMGCLYTPESQAPLGAVCARVIPVPDFSGAEAIWGATGRDHRGHVWFGVSARGNRQPSARLFEYDPEQDAVQERGDVVGELRRAKLAPEGVGQSKIHSRIVQGEDGHLYFASMDEEGERTDGTRLPTWGSHLWRLWLPEGRWEHLLAAREGLIAAAASGRWVYALGYFNHVVHQFDTRTGKTRSTAVGAAGGHISRNCFCDAAGHVYVPRLSAPRGREMAASLVELDTDLLEVDEMPLAHYSRTPDDDSHGMTGFQPLADGSVAFLTDQGHLFRVVPRDGRPAQWDVLGWLHPRRRQYAASLFTSDGKSHLMGLVVRNAPEGRVAEWVVFDLRTNTSVAAPVPLPAVGGQPLEDAHLYGSVTRDNQGRCYLGGHYSRAGRSHPLLLQIRRAASE
jgi:hypothetical protein